MGRWKAIIGPKLKARCFENQQTEAKIGVAILNMRPFAHAEGHDLPWLVDENVFDLDNQWQPGSTRAMTELGRPVFKQIS